MELFFTDCPVSPTVLSGGESENEDCEGEDFGEGYEEKSEDMSEGGWCLIFTEFIFPLSDIYEESEVEAGSVNKDPKSKNLLFPKK